MMAVLNATKTFPPAGIYGWERGIEPHQGILHISLKLQTGVQDGKLYCWYMTHYALMSQKHY
jgi:hypothetical protein